MNQKFHVLHILVEHKFQAEDLILKIYNINDFKKLALKNSLCSSSIKGGDLGPLSIKQVDDDFAEAVLKLKQNQFTDKPVRTKFGYHILWKIS